MKKKDKYNLAIVGATGLVGRTFIKILEERNFPVDNLKLLASARSIGTEIKFKDKIYLTEELKADSFENIDIALFSAGKAGSQFAFAANKQGAIVIDNGSFWRMNPDVPLVVPEVNPEDILKHKGIIANPNCSTIQFVIALKPISDNFGLKRVIVSTYQSITGAGNKGITQLYSELSEANTNQNYKKIESNSIAFNAVFHEITDESGFSIEEIKMKNETRKIMNLYELPISVTCVRLPILAGHGESINIETEKPCSVNEIRELLKSSPGIILIDDPINNKYPTPEIARNTDEVYVGRIRKDEVFENGIHLWVCADNVRKGAATNAVQIAELLIKK